MYVKVHKEGNQWFRDDNGTLVGKTFAIADSEVLIETDNKSSLIAFAGYVDKDSSLIALCKSYTCSYDCLCERKPKCRYTLKNDTSIGYYIRISD